jgi:NTE family protein
MAKSIKELNFGLALSGGGIRAIIFHAGTLAYIAKLGLFESVKVISTVSGGSILMGLIYSLNDGRWPSSEEYLVKIFPQIKGFVCNISIARHWTEQLLNPFWWSCIANRAKVLEGTLEKQWKITGKLGEIGGEPKWYITAAIAKNGEKWIFCRDYMGCDDFGFVKHPDFSLAAAVASSAAYPGIVGPYQLKTSDYIWYKNLPGKNDTDNEIVKPDNDIYYFYDGGLYDNLGCDSLFEKFGEKLIEDIDTVIISDACAPLNTDWFCKWKVWVRTKKMVDMISTHVNDLRLCWIRSYLHNNQKSGILIKIDKHANDLILSGKKDLFKNIIFMPERSIKIVKSIKTNLSRVSSQEYESTVRNGYESALIKSRLYYDFYRSLK